MEKDEVLGQILKKEKRNVLQIRRLILSEIDTSIKVRHF